MGMTTAQDDIVGKPISARRKALRLPRQVGPVGCD